MKSRFDSFISILVSVAFISLAVAPILFMVATKAAAGARIEIKVLPYVRIEKGDKITLLDIVSRQNISAEIENELAAITLADAPKLGEQRVFKNSVVAGALRQGANHHDWVLQIPREIVVENRGYEISEETIRQELNSRWKTICGDCQLEIKSLQLPTISAEYKNTPWFIENDEKLPRGHFAQKIILTKLDGRPVIYWVNGQLEIRKKVPVLNRSVVSNTRLTESDFGLEWRDVTYATDSAADAKEIIGQQAKFMMNSGDIVWRGSLVREKAVQRGEIVRVITSDGTWSISIQAKTEQDGFVGDTVNLRNVQTNKLISGRVTARGEVEVQ